jgi:hypothetical protein
MLDFIVTGLPRSGTTWLANWLTTERSLCLHDPFALGWPETWPRDARRFGIACTGAYLVPDFLPAQACPVAVIERDPAACEEGVTRLGFPPGHMAALRTELDRVEGRRFAFDSLWIEDEARALWAFLLPSHPFDVLRYRLLAQMQVQPHMGKWRPDPDVLRGVSNLVNGSA